MKRIIVFTHLIVVFLTFCRVYGSDGTTDFMVMIQENRQGIQQRALTEISISNPRQFIYHVYDMLKKGKGVEQMKNLLKYTREKNWKQKDLETTCLLKYFEALDELNLSDFDSAEILLKNIIGSEGDIDDKQLVLLAYNALGEINLRKSDLHGAFHYLGESMKYVDEEKSPEVAIDVYYNISELQILAENWNQSFEITKMAIALIEQTGIKTDKLADLYINSGQALSRQGMYKEAKPFFSKVIKGKSENSLASLNQAHREMAIIYEESGNQEMALSHFKASMNYGDLENKQRQEVISEGLKYRKNAQQQIEQIRTKKLTVQKTFLFTSLALLLVSVTMGGRIYNRSKIDKKNRHRLISKNKELHTLLGQINTEVEKISGKHKKLEEQLLRSEKSLFSKELKISTNNDSIKKVASTVSGLISEGGPVAPSKLLLIEKQLLIMTEENNLWEDFKVQFERTRSGFFKKLKALDDSLTVNEMKHCAYVVSRMRSKEVAQLLSVSPRSVETMRYRIKKKFGLGSNQNLYNFLLSV